MKLDHPQNCGIKTRSRQPDAIPGDHVMPAVSDNDYDLTYCGFS
jgi:hypothetical protein